MTVSNATERHKLGIAPSLPCSSRSLSDPAIDLMVVKWTGISWKKGEWLSCRLIPRRDCSVSIRAFNKKYVSSKKHSTEIPYSLLRDIFFSSSRMVILNIHNVFNVYNILFITYVIYYIQNYTIYYYNIIY